MIAGAGGSGFALHRCLGEGEAVGKWEPLRCLLGVNICIAYNLYPSMLLCEWGLRQPRGCWCPCLSLRVLNIHKGQKPCVLKGVISCGYVKSALCDADP